MRALVGLLKGLPLLLLSIPLLLLAHSCNRAGRPALAASWQTKGMRGRAAIAERRQHRDPQLERPRTPGEVPALGRRRAGRQSRDTK